MNDVVNVSQICALNDAFRRSLTGGVLIMTRGVIALGLTHQVRILEAVAAFDSFGPDDDPYGEHDFGALEVEGTRLFWKIDYFDRALTGHSPDPADPSVTTRVLTIMLAEEY